MDRYFHSEKAINRPGLSQRAPTKYFTDCEIYFTCEGDEKLLPEVLQWIGDDKMMISGDMPDAEARDNSITEIKERNDISEAQKKKNSRRQRQAVFRPLESWGNGSRFSTT